MKNAQIIATLACLSLSSLRADVITEWNALMNLTFAAEGATATPPTNSRTMGMMGGAMFDAVNSINHNRYDAYQAKTTRPIAMVVLQRRNG